MPDTDDPTTETPSDTPQEPPADKGGLGDGGQKALAAERDARKAAEKALKDATKASEDLAAKVKSFEDRDKSASEKDAERIAELEKALADKDSALASKDLEKLRIKVAHREGKHVPVEALTGSTEEELIASADKLLEWRGPTGSVSSLRQQGFRSGASAPPDGSSAKEKAAAALRGLRAG